MKYCIWIKYKNHLNSWLYSICIALVFKIALQIYCVFLYLYATTRAHKLVLLQELFVGIWRVSSSWTDPKLTGRGRGCSLQLSWCSVVVAAIPKGVYHHGDRWRRDTEGPGGSYVPRWWILPKWGHQRSKRMMCFKILSCCLVLYVGIGGTLMNGL